MRPFPPLNHRARFGPAAFAGLVAAALALVAGLMSLSGPAGAAPARLLAERGYVVEIRGVDGPLEQAGAETDLREALAGVSRLIAGQDNPPAGIGGLRRRAEGDVVRMGKLLRSLGYFDARVAYEFASPASDPRGGAAAGDGPLKVIIRVAPGPRFAIGTTRVVYLDAPQAAAQEPPQEAPQEARAAELPRQLPGPAVAPGRPAVAKALLEAEAALLRDLRDRGYPFAAIEGRTALANIETATLDVETRVRLGPAARFGPLTIEGLRHVDRRFIERRLAWRPGDVFRQSLLRETRLRLAKSGLFESVRFELADAVSPDGTIAVKLVVSERSRRTIGGGLSYSSTEGFTLRAYWENRNLMGNGQHLRLESDVSRISQSFTGRYRVGAFRRADQVLELAARLAREETDAYDRWGGLMSAAIERPLAARWLGRAALFADIAQLDEVGEPPETALLAGLEMRATFDSTDHALDPTRGMRFTLAATPHAGRYESALSFATATAQLSSYVELVPQGRLVLANRVKAGTLLGARTGEVPPDKRFYAGGAGSVRGFEYQDISPLGPDGSADGGRSLAELSTELRWRVTDKIGIVPFADGGTVSDAPYPEFAQEMAWAAGLGLRYYTGFGPVGLDVAYPLSIPSNEAAALSFYVTLGQAF